MSTEQAGDAPEGVSDTGMVDSARNTGSEVPDLRDTSAPTAAPSDSGSDEPDDAVYYEEQVEPEYGILGLTLRELIIVGTWAVAFIVSFFAVSPGGGSVWTRGIDWILTIGLPTVAVFLVVLRRFSPEGIRRVGSLGIDQFASVAAAVSAVAWAQLLWRQTAVSIDTGAFLVGWVPIVAQIAALGLVAATVVAPLIPRLRDDFHGRMETLAHRNANPVRPVVVRPRPVPAQAPAPSADDDPGGQGVSAPPVVETDLTVAATAPASAATSIAPDDATRVIEVLPVADGAPRAADHTLTGDARFGGPDARDAGTAYTDPIRALDEIFASNQHPLTDAGHPTDDDAPTDADAPTDVEVAAAGASTEPPSRSELRADVIEPQADDAPPITTSAGTPGLRRTRSEQAAAPKPDAGPFWILAATERDVLDEHGNPLFRIGPSAWTLVIEDRGGAYVVRHDDGRIGYLHDLTDITKG